ncbi:hypothetical protein M0R45_012993 [Rubus argutus]|uniref:Uncharacterized protein n=1 Tax=Rubus argutus TaxID=59490 RepID=A0AAW1XHF7_RUBAR
MDSLSVMLFHDYSTSLSPTISGAEDPLSTFCSTDARKLRCKIAHSRVISRLSLGHCLLILPFWVVSTMAALAITATKSMDKHFVEGM